MNILSNLLHNNRDEVSYCSSTDSIYIGSTRIFEGVSTGHITLTDSNEHGPLSYKKAMRLVLSQVGDFKILNSGDHIHNITWALKEFIDLYDINIRTEGGTILVDTENNFITEEPNTSLMYYKLFKNKTLLRKLESFGYKFKMGSGLKLQKKAYSTTNRTKSPSKHRTMQSIVILKDGRLYRKIPKAAWIQLQDPSDADSKTWGEIFMQKLVDNEERLLKSKLDALSKRKKDVD